MKIDEAIATAKEVADDMRQQIMSEPNKEIMQKCVECIDEHEQLAEWLTELKEARKGFEENRKAGYKHGYSDGYNKAIDEFLVKILRYFSLSRKNAEIDTRIFKWIAEQLKGE